MKKIQKLLLVICLSVFSISAFAQSPNVYTEKINKSSLESNIKGAPGDFKIYKKILGVGESVDFSENQMRAVKGHFVRKIRKERMNLNSEFKATSNEYFNVKSQMLNIYMTLSTNELSGRSFSDAAIANMSSKISELNNQIKRLSKDKEISYTTISFSEAIPSSKEFFNAFSSQIEKMK